MLLVAVCAGAFLPPVAATAANQTLSPGTIYERSAPGAPFPASADGRINGPGFQAQVTGIATGPGFGSGSDSEPAPPGNHVLAFTFAWHPAITYVVGPSPYEADVAVAGQRVALPAQDLAFGGTFTYAVVVPDRAPDVVLNVSASGVTQAFSLNHGARIQPEITAYYRDPIKGLESVNFDEDATVTATAPTPSDASNPIPPQPVDFHVGSASLQYLSPDGEAAPSPTRAWLVVDLSASFDYTSGGLNVFGVIPNDRITLRLPNGTSSAAQVKDATPLTQGVVSIGPYYFAVPGNLTTAQIVIDGGSVPSSTNVTPDPSLPATFSAPVTLPIDVPAEALPATPGPVVPPGPSTTATAGRAAAGTFSWPWLAAGLALIVAAVAGLVTGRRGRRAGRRRVIDVRSLPGGATHQIGAPARALPAPSSSSDGSDAPTGAMGSASARAVAIDAPAESLVLGPPGTRGTGMARGRKRILTEILAYLALHLGDAFSSDELAALLRPHGTVEVFSRETVKSYISKLRAWLPDECLPDATETGGYKLQAVGCDWHRLCHLVDKADDAADTDEEAELLWAALRLVRGQPFAGVFAQRKRGSRAYEWVESEGWISRMERKIDDAVARLVELELQRGRRREAGEALSRGLKALPDSLDLHRLRVKLAESYGPAAAAQARAEADAHFEGAAGLLGDD